MAVENKVTAHWQSIRVKLTAAALVLHSYVHLVIAGVLVEFTLVAVVLPIAAAHYLLGFADAPEGAHALCRQAVCRLDAGASVAAGHLRAGVLQRWGNQAHERLAFRPRKGYEADGAQRCSTLCNYIEVVDTSNDGLGCHGNAHFNKQVVFNFPPCTHNITGMPEHYLIVTSGKKKKQPSVYLPLHKWERGEKRGACPPVNSWFHF